MISLVCNDANQLIILFQRNPNTSNVSAYGVDMDHEVEFLSDGASEHIVTTRVEATLLTPPLHFTTPPAQSSPEALPARIRNDDDDSHQSPLSDRPPSAPPFFHPTRVQRHSATRLSRIESELNQARSDVREKDQAITTLRVQLSELQKAANARSLRERGGLWHGGDEENG